MNVEQALAVRYTHIADANALVDRGLTVDESCRIVGLDPLHFRRYEDLAGSTFYPTPAEIEAATA